MADSRFFYTFTASSTFSIITLNIFTTRNLAYIHPTKTGAAADEQIALMRKFFPVHY